MGGSQSTREVMVTNGHVIDIKMSEDTLRRLSTADANADVSNRMRASGNHEPSGSGDSFRSYANSDVDSIRQEIELEYRQRIMDSSAQNLKIKAEEYAKAVQDVEAKFIKETGSPVCQDLRQSVLACYQDNLRKPLVCSKEVKAFAQAVERERRKVVLASKQA